jgi:hypothetical protein
MVFNVPIMALSFKLTNNKDLIKAWKSSAKLFILCPAALQGRCCVKYFGSNC